MAHRGFGVGYLGQPTEAWWDDETASVTPYLPPTGTEVWTEGGEEVSVSPEMVAAAGARNVNVTREGIVQVSSEAPPDVQAFADQVARLPKAEREAIGRGKAPLPIARPSQPWDTKDTLVLGAVAVGVYLFASSQGWV